MAPSNRSGRSLPPGDCTSPRRCSRSTDSKSWMPTPSRWTASRPAPRSSSTSRRERWPHGHEAGVAGGLPVDDALPLSRSHDTDASWRRHSRERPGSLRARRPAARADRRIGDRPFVERHDGAAQRPFRGVGSGDFCPLYPIAVPYALLKNAQPGAVSSRCPRERRGPVLVADVGRKPERTDTRREPRPSGDSYTYVNPTTTRTGW